MEARDKAKLAQIDAKIENANKEIQKQEAIKITLLNQKNAIIQKQSQELPKPQHCPPMPKCKEPIDTRLKISLEIIKRKHETNKRIFQTNGEINAKS